MPKVKRQESSEDDGSSSGSDSDAPPPKKGKGSDKVKEKVTKKKPDSSSDSGPDDIEPPKPKSATGKSSSSSSSKGEENSWTLDRNRFVKLNEFRGRVNVDIREYYEKDGKLLPGKKGMSLSASQWQKLKEFIPEIDKALKKF